MCVVSLLPLEVGDAVLLPGVDAPEPPCLAVTFLGKLMLQFLHDSEAAVVAALAPAFGSDSEVLRGDAGGVSAGDGMPVAREAPVAARDWMEPEPSEEEGGVELQ